MPPQRFTNPPPKTESARSAVKAFFCELCNKGYARMNEWEAHEGSYDHQHRKRLKELSRMQRDPNASSKARERERRDDARSGIAGFKDVSAEESATTKAGPGKGFKKGGFKSAFGGKGEEVRVVVADEGKTGPGIGPDDREIESESEDDPDKYDPRRPTGCERGCSARR